MLFGFVRNGGIVEKRIGELQVHGKNSTMTIKFDPELIKHNAFVMTGDSGGKVIVSNNTKGVIVTCTDDAVNCYPYRK